MFDVELLIAFGVHVPETPFGDVVFNAGTAEPEQIEFGKTKSGVIALFIVIVFENEVAQLFAAGVKT